MVSRIETQLEENKQQELEATLRKNLTSKKGENFMRSIAQKKFEEGREEGVIATAINMLKQNLSTHLIAQVTGLSLDKIKALKASL